MQALPLPAEYVFAGQREHLPLIGSVDDEPAAQAAFWHCTDPPDEYCPRVQATHCLLAVEAPADDAEPAAHVVASHCAGPPAENCPALHWAHVPLIGSVDAKPGAQDTFAHDADPPAEKLPVAQAVQPSVGLFAPPFTSVAPLPCLHA